MGRWRRVLEAPARLSKRTALYNIDLVRQPWQPAEVWQSTTPEHACRAILARDVDAYHRLVADCAFPLDDTVPDTNAGYVWDSEQSLDERPLALDELANPLILER